MFLVCRRCCWFVYIGLPSAARASGPCVCHSRGALWGGCGPPAARFGIMSASEAADGSSPGLCPSFAVICSFLERYGPLLDLPEVSFPVLERSLQESSAGEPLLHCCYQAALDAFTLGFNATLGPLVACVGVFVHWCVSSVRVLPVISVFCGTKRLILLYVYITAKRASPLTLLNLGV